MLLIDKIDAKNAKSTLSVMAAKPSGSGLPRCAVGYEKKLLLPIILRLIEGAGVGLGIRFEALNQLLSLSRPIVIDLIDGTDPVKTRA